MCGRFSQHYTWQEIVEFMRLVRPETPLNIEPRYNIAPTQWIDVVRRVIEGPHRGTGNELTHMRWDLVPFFWKKPLSEKKFSTFNARAENVASTPSYRGPFRHHRCLIPASGFFEWPRPKKPGEAPVYIRPAKGALFAFAGLSDEWTDPVSGDMIESCSIITTRANGRIRPLHPRMPVILAPDSWDVWLDAQVQDAKVLQPLLRPCPEDDIEIVPVSDCVNSVRHQGPDCIAPCSAQ